MSAVTMSGEVNNVRPPDTRGLTSGQVKVAESSPSRTETLAAARQPAAVLDPEIERFIARGTEAPSRTIDTYPDAESLTEDIPDGPINEHASALQNNTKLAQKVQSQIASISTEAILAQAKQLPNPAMAFSTGE